MLANDSITVTPGAGAAVATHMAAAKEHQVFLQADESGHIAGTVPTYRMFVPPAAAGASKIYFDLFNATASGKTIKLLSCVPVVSGAVAVTGALAVDLYLTRTSAVGTGGVAATGDAVGAAVATLTVVTIAKHNPADPALPAGITARTVPTGGATAGQVLAVCSLFTEETNAGSYTSSLIDLAMRAPRPAAPIVIPENTGVRVLQGTVASVGNIGFDLTFEVA